MSKLIFDDDLQSLCSRLLDQFYDERTPLGDLAFKIGGGVLGFAFNVLPDSPGSARHLLDKFLPEPNSMRERMRQAAAIVCSTAFIDRSGQVRLRAQVPFLPALIKVLLDDFEELFGCLSDQQVRGEQAARLVMYFLVFSCVACEEHPNAALTFRLAIIQDS